MAKLFTYTFGRIPDDLLWDAGLSDRACRLYAVLTRYGDQWSRDLPDQEELAKVLGCSTASAKRAIAELKDRGALTVSQERDQGGQFEWTYRMPWEQGPVSPVTPHHGSPVTDGVTSRDNASVQVGPQVTSDPSYRRERKASPNGDGAGINHDGRADTIVGKCIDALGFTPVERGAFAKIITEAAKTVSSEDLLLRAVREWGKAGEPVTYLTGRIGTMDREARARARRNGNGYGGTAAVRHDGKHDRSCWCYDVPEEQRAKVQHGDLLRAAGLKPKTAEEAQAEIDTGDAQATAEGHCCASHTRTCEPPSELCCVQCPEARHPEHPDGVPCVLGVTSE